MAKTYEQLMRQIESLQAEADRLRKKEAGDVVGRIREAIAHYGITAADLGLAAGRTRRASAAEPKTPARKSRSGAAIKYRGSEPGQAWVGRGKRPQWLRDALAAGRQLEDFRVR